MNDSHGIPLSFGGLSVCHDFISCLQSGDDTERICCFPGRDYSCRSENSHPLDKQEHLASTSGEGRNARFHLCPRPRNDFVSRAIAPVFERLFETKGRQRIYSDRLYF